MASVRNEQRGKSENLMRVGHITNYLNIRLGFLLKILEGEMWRRYGMKRSRGNLRI